MYDSLYAGAHSQHLTESSANRTEENSNFLRNAELVKFPLMAQGHYYNTFEHEVFTVHGKGQMFQAIFFPRRKSCYCHLDYAGKYMGSLLPVTFSHHLQLSFVSSETNISSIVFFKLGWAHTRKLDGFEFIIFLLPCDFFFKTSLNTTRFSS